MIINAQKNTSFMNILNKAELIIPDGVGVEIALKLKRIKLARIRGVDFSRALIKMAAENNYRIGFLGAKE